MQGDQGLKQMIVEKIKGSPMQCISFKEYMEMCLYDPVGGYYMKDKEKIGPGGDFYTSASVGGVMGEVLARYIATALNGQDAERIKPFTLVEWGSGTGALAAQILDELKRSLPKLYPMAAYISVEKSPAHRLLQAEKLAAHKDHVSWMTEQEWLERGAWERVIVISNELIDAFAVHLVQIDRGSPCEIYIGLDEAEESFQEKLISITDGPLLSYVTSIDMSLKEGQRLEVNLEGLTWLQQVSSAIQSGKILTIDYGDLADELYAAHRFKGTLMCYQQHKAHVDPYKAPGEQDMTAHVNFSALMQEGEKAGLQTELYLTQKQFLVENGILQLLQDTLSVDPFSAVARRNRSIRQLLLSDQMSELFKVLVQKKGELL